MSTYDMLRAHYATRSDEELKTIAGVPDLPPDARRALNDEQAHRKADPETRRQANIAALMAALEQEKQDRIAKTRRTLLTAIGFGLACAAMLVLYTMRQVLPATKSHAGLLLFSVLFLVAAIVAWVARRRHRAGLRPRQSDEPPAP
ncbi:MAG TPA: hypothetical protein VF798_04810, partial [Burkholderiaceae bacterium]